MLSVCKKSIAVVISAACISGSIAQVNIIPDAINFRDASKIAQRTNHYGNLQVSGDGTGSDAGSGGTSIGAVIYAKNNSTSISDIMGIYGTSSIAAY